MKTYDPQKIIVTFAGFPITGFADGTFVKVSRNVDTFSLTVGADGEAARVKSADKSGRVVLTVLQTSQANDLLNAQAQIDELTGFATAPVMIKDLNGNTLVSAVAAWVIKPPDSEFAKDVSEREWTIESDALLIETGGALL